MKPEYTIITIYWFNYITVVPNMNKFDSQNSVPKIYKTPLILLHVARLMSRLAGVRPAVDLSWEAL